jgi:hypothetical protein
MVAFVAAFVLLLQSFATAWSAGAMPATPALDAFGNALCITSVDHDGEAPAGDHSKPLNCCTFFCNAASPLLATPSGAGFALLPPLVRSNVPFTAPKTVHVKAPDHDPGSPRAPPLTA